MYCSWRAVVRTHALNICVSHTTRKQLSSEDRNKHTSNITSLPPLFSHTASVHCNDVMLSAMASQITDAWRVYLIVPSGTDQRKHQSSVSRGIHRWSVNSPHKGPITRKNVSIWWRHHAFGKNCIKDNEDYQHEWRSSWHSCINEIIRPVCDLYITKV